MDEITWIRISGLQHWIFCKRQCGLIHVANIWQDNALTQLGNALHRRTDTPAIETRPGIRIVRALPLVSEPHGLIGKADVVEFHQQDGQPDWVPYPVEYKRGQPKQNLEDHVQLCAQALCLEAMFGCIVPEGAMYYGKTRRRQVVALGKALRSRTLEAIAEMRAMIVTNTLPPSEFGPKCASCSLQEACLPEIQQLDVQSYLKSAGL